MFGHPPTFSPPDQTDSFPSLHKIKIHFPHSHSSKKQTKGKQTIIKIQNCNFTIHRLFQIPLGELERIKRKFRQTPKKEKREKKRKFKHKIK